MRGSRWSSVGVVAAIAAALFTGSCSSGGGGAGAGTARKDGGTPASGSSGGGSVADATVGCVTDADCGASVPPTRAAPGVGANCAAGKCNALQGTCEYVAKDEDGDGHAAANCKSTNGVPIRDGDDCNDLDPNLYPGHSESCTTLPDGGVVASGLCASGAISCQADGTESPCLGTTVCMADQACVSGQCTGVCSPGQTQCVGNEVQTCSAGGTWSAPVPCNNSTCSAGVCQGACSQGETQCSGNGVEACESGMWGTPAPCSNSTCVTQGDAGNLSASCVGQCAPGQTQCSGDTPQTCGAGGQWVSGAVCTNVCSAGSCAGACSPNATRCSGTTPQTCSAAGQWVNGPIVANTCGAACTPNSTGFCGPCNNGAKVCGATGAWGGCSGGTSPTTFYRDMDGDGYGNINVTTSACSAPSGYVADDTDCYDGNYDAHPGQTGWFPTNRGDGSFDYNCDGVEEEQVPSTAPNTVNGCIGNCCAQTGACVAGASTCGPNFEVTVGIVEQCTLPACGQSGATVLTSTCPAGCASVTSATYGTATQACH